MTSRKNERRVSGDDSHGDHPYPAFVPASEKRKIKAREYKERLDALEKKIKLTNPSFDFPELVRAFNWEKRASNTPEAKNSQKLNKSLSVDDYFSDTLLIVENLVRFAKVDRETLLASVLYRAVRPVDDAAVTPEKLKEINAKLDDIEDKFGPTSGASSSGVRQLVERTLRFRAFKMLNPKEGATCDISDNITMFRMMALWVAEDPRAILIRAVQMASNLKRIADGELTPDKATVNSMTERAAALHAPLCYLSGYGDLRTDLLNRCYEIEDKAGYDATCAVLAAAYKGNDRDEAQAVIIKAVTAQIKGLGLIPDDDFTVCFREKSPASIRAKIEDKGIDACDLGDLFGVRVVLNPSAIGWMEGLRPDDMLASDVKDILGRKCKQIYGTLSKEFGRNNTQKTDVRLNSVTNGEERFSYIQERLAELAINEPREKDGCRLKDKVRAELEKNLYPNIKDARFDDYMTEGLVKASGYSSLQDTMWFRMPNGEMLEVETQVLDKDRHEFNTYDAKAGHVPYKLKLGKHAKEALGWRAAASAVTQGGSHKAKRVYVIDRFNQTFDITRDPTLGGFLAAVHKMTGRVPAHGQYQINNGYDVSERTAEMNAVLTVGSTIVPASLVR